MGVEGGKRGRCVFDRVAFFFRPLPKAMTSSGRTSRVSARRTAKGILALRAFGDVRCRLDQRANQVWIFAFFQRAQSVAYHVFRVFDPRFQIKIVNRLQIFEISIAAIRQLKLMRHVFSIAARGRTKYRVAVGPLSGTAFRIYFFTHRFYHLDLHNNTGIGATRGD